MEESRRRDSSSLLVLPDLTVDENFGPLSASDSDSNSSLIVENSKGRLQQIEDSAKLKMIQDDSSEKIDLKRSQPLMNSAVDSLVLLKSRPRCAGKQRFARAAKRQDNSAARNLCTEDKLFFSEAGIRSERISARHEKLVDCSADQNFADEASEQICITTMSKRSKTIVSEV